MCSKPCVIFTGDLFETDTNYIRLKNVLIGTYDYCKLKCMVDLEKNPLLFLWCMIDFFRGPDLSQIRLAGLDHVMCFTACEGKIYFRIYK